MVPSLIDLSNVSTAGEFICEVETYGEPISQHNQLEVLGEFLYLAYEVNKSKNVFVLYVAHEVNQI